MTMNNPARTAMGLHDSGSRTATMRARTVALTVVPLVLLAAGCDAEAGPESVSTSRQVCVAPGEGLLPSATGTSDSGRVKADHYCEPDSANGVELWNWPTGVELPEPGDIITDPSRGPFIIANPPTRTNTR